MRKLVYSKESIANLKKIYDHTKNSFTDRKALLVIENLFEKIASLQKFPYLGKTSEISTFVRELIVEGNAIYYLLTDETIDIVFIKPRMTTLLKKQKK